MKKIIITISIALGVLLIGVTVFFTATPAGRACWNNYENTLQQVDDDTSYETRKKVEDTCRSMIASYKTDKLTYETYKDSDDAVLKSSANQARIRANQTANSYNEYVLKNSYVWKNNVPDDIVMELEFI
jgi:uncharacterized protein YpmS